MNLNPNYEISSKTLTLRGSVQEEKKKCDQIAQ